MKFEVTYTDGSKVQVDLADARILALLDQEAKNRAQNVALKNETARGLPSAVKVIA